MSQIIISICIATYNRANYLKKLVESILLIKRTDIEVVVTDNCSTDNTIEILMKIQDDRLRVCKNEKPLRASMNMIESIFNANGKYAFYVNDRDVIFSEKLEQVINLLYTDDFSFVQTLRQRVKNSEELKKYDKGYDSIIHQSLVQHPTGMIYNRELISQYCKKSDYYNYIKEQYTYSFLMRDLLPYEKSAVYDIGCWGQPGRSFLKKNRSGTGDPPYFYPEIRFNVMKTTMIHIIEGNRYRLTKEQEIAVEKYILKYFADLLILYKFYMSDSCETAHYGVNDRFVSTVEMLHVFSQYHKQSLLFLEENDYPEELLSSWKNEYWRMAIRTLLRSLKADINIVKRWGKDKLSIV